MSDLIEDTVLGAVVESLQVISPANDYHTELPLPTVVVSREAVTSPPDGEAYRIAFAVDFLAAGSGRADKVRRALNFVADIRRRLLVEDPRLGGLVLGIDETVSDEADGALSRNDGSARLNFEALVGTAYEKEQA